MRRQPGWINAALVAIGIAFTAVGVASIESSALVGYVGAFGGLMILAGGIAAWMKQRRSERRAGTRRSPHL